MSWPQVTNIHLLLYHAITEYLPACSFERKWENSAESSTSEAIAQSQRQKCWHLFESLGVVPPPECAVTLEYLLYVSQGQWNVGGTALPSLTCRMPNWCSWEHLAFRTRNVSSNTLCIVRLFAWWVVISCTFSLTLCGKGRVESSETSNCIWLCSLVLSQLFCCSRSWYTVWMCSHFPLFCDVSCDSNGAEDLSLASWAVLHGA